MTDQQLKEHSCGFAAWLWGYVTERHMALTPWEVLYDEYLLTLKEKRNG